MNSVERELDGDLLFSVRGEAPVCRVKEMSAGRLVFTRRVREPSARLMTRVVVIH